MSTPFIKVYLTEEEKRRIKNFLQGTYRGSASELMRRTVLEKVSDWEQHEEELQLRRAALEAS